MIYLRLHSSSICNLFLFFICQQLLVDYAESFTKNGSVSTSPARSSEHLSRIYHPQRRQLFMVGDAQGDYYGESSGSYMVKELSLIEELENIVQLASQPIPERPDGIVVVVKYSSANRQECRATEAEYERFARNNPASIFMRCMEEYEGAHLLLEQVDIRSW